MQWGKKPEFGHNSARFNDKGSAYSPFFKE